MRHGTELRDANLVFESSVLECGTNLEAEALLVRWYLPLISVLESEMVVLARVEMFVTAISSGMEFLFALDDRRA